MKRWGEEWVGVSPTEQKSHFSQAARPWHVLTHQLSSAQPTTQDHTNMQLNSFPWLEVPFKNALDLDLY